MEIIKKYKFLILVILFTFVAVLPLMQPGFFPIHDDEQVGRLYELNYALESLHFPPRISQNLGFGYGYPFFNFYPPFVYYVAQLFVFLGFGYIASIKIMIGIGFILSAVFMYLFSRKYVGDLGGLVAAVLYTYAPYHSVDVYVRGALPEFFSFVFIPAIFWSLERLSRKQNIGNVLLLSILGAFLMLTHNLVMLMSIPFFAAYFLFTLYKNKNWKSYFVSVLSGGILALLLSSYFWIPAILENKYTMVNLLTKELASYQLHFVSIPQFINSPWGYGGSILGPMDGMSLEVGKIHLLLVGATLLIFGFNYFVKKIKIEKILILFSLLFIFSIFIQSYYASFIWDNFFALSYIQFPWRFMLFAVFTASFISGFLFVLKINQKFKLLIAAVIIGISLVYYGQFFRPSEYLEVSDKDYTEEAFIRWDTSIKAFEYVPFGFVTRTSDLGTTIVDISKNEIASQTAILLNGELTYEVIADKPQYKKLEYVALTDSKLQLNTYTFPGWKVFLNEKEVMYNDDNKFKLITVIVPYGEGILEAKFTETKIRLLGNLLTISGILLVLFSLPFYKRNIKI